MESNAHEQAPAPVPTFTNPDQAQKLDAEETEWNSRLLQSKANRVRIEENVNALRNRISFLENEEMKLISNIEATKTRALEVIKIKRDARVHNEAVKTHQEENVMHVEIRKEEVSDMRTDLSEGLHQALQQNKDLQLSKADEVKASLNILKDYYRETKKTEHRSNMEKVSVQRTFEQELDDKKSRILRDTMAAARSRYESQISDEESRATAYANAINRLEKKEQDMLQRLQMTQTQHQLYMDDFEKINANQDPTGPLSSLRNSFSLSGRKNKLMASPKPRVSPKKEVSPLNQRSPMNKSGSGAKSNKQRKTYEVNDFYR